MFCQAWLWANSLLCLSHVERSTASVCILTQTLVDHLSVDRALLSDIKHSLQPFRNLPFLHSWTVFAQNRFKCDLIRNANCLSVTFCSIFFNCGHKIKLTWSRCAHYVDCASTNSQALPVLYYLYTCTVNGSWMWKKKKLIGFQFALSTLSLFRIIKMIRGTNNPSTSIQSGRRTFSFPRCGFEVRLPHLPMEYHNIEKRKCRAAFTGRL